ncbi:hypothetical protein E4198_01145 [Streptomyces sp. RKND-216]|uniref:hypothetical protein n=1 Tax=Streptomyces sp. RKND-216 TaxID=2562581 RepID=UPI00109E1814|nr:hypothetical protein [Streptomyces sp. RKND-216]THA23530.1 hypothetical protein E4198_01145 [Streptomyces sp. RKND-216]
MTTDEAQQTDRLEAFVTKLADGLHGPVRAKRRLLAEIRDGLAETVSWRSGSPRASASRRCARLTPAT